MTLAALAGVWATLRGIIVCWPGDARLLVPGHPEQSIIHDRMKRLGLGRMPHIASRVVDEQGVKLVHDWIKQVPR